MESREPLKIRFAPKGFMPLPDGKYPAKVIDVRARVTAYGDSINIMFEIVEGKYKERQIGKYLKVGREGDTLWQWVEILTGACCDEWNDYDLLVLIGKTCLIGVEKRNRIYDIYRAEEDESTRFDI